MFFIKSCNPIKDNPPCLLFRWNQDTSVLSKLDLSYLVLKFSLRALTSIFLSVTSQIFMPFFSTAQSRSPTEIKFLATFVGMSARWIPELFTWVCIHLAKSTLSAFLQKLGTASYSEHKPNYSGNCSSTVLSTPHDSPDLF